LLWCLFSSQVIVIPTGGGQEIKIDQETAKTQIIPLSSVEIYDPITNTWEQGPELPEPLCGAGVLKYNATIYVLGKYDQFSKTIIIMLYYLGHLSVIASH
jgi:hypothetical protein